MLPAARLNTLLQRNQNSLDFIRFVAAIMVIFSHAFPLSLGMDFQRYDPMVWLTNSQATSGTVAVNIFFVISGFLITASMVQSQNALTYLKARFLRIYPGLLVVVLLTMFVLGPLVTTLSLREYLSDPATYQYLGMLRLNGSENVLPGVFATNNFAFVINPSLWTLYYEVLCYLLILLLWLTRLLKKRWILGLFIEFLGLNLIGYLLVPTLSGFGIHNRLFDLSHAVFFSDLLSNFMHLTPLFLSGGVFYFYRNRIVMKPRYLTLGVIFLVVSIITGTGFITLWFPTFGTYTLLYVASSSRSPFKSFGKHGDFSYGLYIYAGPVQQTLTYLFGGVMLPMVNFALAMPITLFIAMLSWHFVEKPALRLKHKPLRFYRKTPAPEAGMG